MKVYCEVEYGPVDGANGILPGTIVTCTRCHHVTESYGTSERSVKRCLALLREECPDGETNYYTTEETEEDLPSWKR